jgi:nitrous oxidase accessory protein
MKRGAAALLCLALALAAGAPAVARSPSLQELIDRTPDGGVLRPPAGSYAGPIVVRRPITIDGQGRVRIDSGGEGTVVRLLTSGATIRGLTLVNSGSNHDKLDAGVQVRGHGNRIEDNVIEDCLFGVDLQQSNDNVVANNRIRSKPVEMGMRGDSVRLWYSRNNEIRDNEISNVRDMVVWYSAHNRIVGNRVSNSRYALHFMYADANRVEGNHYDGNMVGVFLMYSDGVVLRGNVITGSMGATGMGVGFKESSDVTLEDNEIIHCARGLYLDISPYEPDTTNRFLGNRFAYNGTGVVFHNDWEGNVFRANTFDENFTQVAVRGGGSAGRNVWDGNRWDDYRGFDRDGDGIGDTAYDLFSYADRIWQMLPEAAFFRGSPLFEVIDFLDRLAPFTAPTRVLRDSAPRFDLVTGEQPWRR